MSTEKRYYDLTYKDIAEALVVKLDLHEGLWGIRVKYGIGAINGLGPDGKVVPIAMVPLLGIGLQSFDVPGDLTVDAAECNPIQKKSAKMNRKSVK
jgi:hypothetical protein